MFRVRFAPGSTQLVGSAEAGPLCLWSVDHQRVLRVLSEGGEVTTIACAPARPQQPFGHLQAREHTLRRLERGDASVQRESAAVRAMAELGIDLSEAAGCHAKSREVFIGQPPMGLVMTVCDEAAEESPVFPGARRQVHWGFPDPSKATGTEEERLAVFRQVRDGLARRIDAFQAQAGVTAFR